MQYMDIEQGTLSKMAARSTTDAERLIMKAVEAEVKRVNEIHPLYHSGHEAIAVLAEEVEEAREELESIKVHLAKMWERVRMDFELNYPAELVKEHAIELANEAVQVAAACERIMRMCDK